MKWVVAMRIYNSNQLRIFAEHITDIEYISFLHSLKEVFLSTSSFILHVHKFADFNCSQVRVFTCSIDIINLSQMFLDTL
jgi:hypothetical protein